MGLDMYIDAKQYFFSDDPLQVKLTKVAKDVLGEMEIKEITARAAYWRKANHIHKWFVDNVQNFNDDCGEYYVSRETLQKLLDTVNKVLKDTTLAAELLPTQEGFFFGSTSIDEFYFQDLEYTKETLEKLLTDEYKQWDFYYHSSW